MIVDSVDRRIFAEDLAIEAGKLALSYRGLQDLDVRSKGVLDWVTEADLAAERLIRRRIGESFPLDRFLGEEGGGDVPPAGAGHVTWVVDPIDGTTCFVSGPPSWCVSIACVGESGHPFLGVIRDPEGAETFSAMEGHGLTINGRGISVPKRGITEGLVGLSESGLRAWDALVGEVLIRESGGWSTSFMRDGSLATSKPVLAANRGSAAALWDLADGVLEGWSRPEQHNGH